MGDRGKWTKQPNPVLAPSQAWEANCVAEPKVIVEPDGSFTMFYTGGWGNHGIGRATSPNGIAWTKHAGNPVIGLNAAGVPLAAHHGARKLPDGRYEIVFSDIKAGGYWSLYRALSSDGIAFAVHPVPVLPYDASYSTPANPCAVDVGNGREVMLYASQYPSPPGGSSIWYQFLAHRADAEGYAWIKDSRGGSTPGLAITSNGTRDVVSVQKIGDWLYGWSINAPSGGNLPTEVYTHRTKDLWNWQQVNGNQPSLWRSLSWEVDQVADPNVHERGGQCFMFYSGMHNPAAQGRIGLATYNGALAQLVA